MTLLMTIEVDSSLVIYNTRIPPYAYGSWVSGVSAYDRRRLELPSSDYVGMWQCELYNNDYT